jgi:hypothetical protein
VSATLEEARECGIPVFQELSRAVECMAAVFRVKRNIHHEGHEEEKGNIEELG